MNPEGLWDAAQRQLRGGGVPGPLSCPRALHGLQAPAALAPGVRLALCRKDEPGGV